MSRAAVLPPTLSFSTAARTHVGLRRKLNEDGYLARPEVGLWAVADGMGGHQAGDVASRMIVEALTGVRRQASGFALLSAMREALVDVNQALMTRAAAMAEGSVIGSTVASLVVHENHYACVWAGDSRAYLLRGELLMRLTHDHSLIQELIDGGQLDEEEARRRRISNIITRAVGAGDTLELEESHGDIQAGDLFLLCSDGLTGLVDDGEIRDILAAFDLEAAADRLLALTLERGAKDNVTLVLVRAA
jgi:serine/threonine protein phosphatase PrpC